MLSRTFQPPVATARRATPRRMRSKPEPFHRYDAYEKIAAKLTGSHDASVLDDVPARSGIPAAVLCRQNNYTDLAVIFDTNSSIRVGAVPYNNCC